MITLTVNVNVTQPVHIHMHEETNPALLERVARLEVRQNALDGDLMATNQEFNDRMSALDSATNEIASDLQALRDKIAAGVIPQEAIGMLDQRIATLQALGRDPENPVPPATDAPSTTDAPASTDSPASADQPQA